MEVSSDKKFLFSVFYYYVIYFFLYHVVNLGTFSLFTFFHFLLQHNFQVIDDWVVRHSWENILFAKVIALFFLHRVLLGRYKNRQDFLREIKEEFRLPPIYFFLMVTALHIFWVYLCKIQFNPAVHNLFFLHFFTYVGVAIFYICDLYILKCLQDIFEPVNKNELFLTTILVTLFIFIGNSLGIPFAPSLKYLIPLNFLFMIFFQLLKPSHFWWNFLLVLLFFAPSAIWWGFDPIREDRYTFFQVDHIPNMLEWGSLLLLAATYLAKMLKKNENFKIFHYNKES